MPVLDGLNEAAVLELFPHHWLFLEKTKRGHEGLAAAMAADADCPADILASLAHPGANLYVRLAVLRHPNCCPTTMRDLWTDFRFCVPWIQQAAIDALLENTNRALSTTCLIDSHVEFCVCKQIIKDVSVPVDTMVPIFNLHAADKCLVQKIMEHPNCPDLLRLVMLT